MLNKVVLIGRLTKDVDLKFLPGSGVAVANFSIAVDRSFKKEGQQDVDFIPITVWNKQAESASKYIHKGSLVGISGRLQISSYEAKDGAKRYRTDVVADEVQFLDSKGDSNSQSPSESKNTDEESTSTVEDDDIPF